MNIAKRKTLAWRVIRTATITLVVIVLLAAMMLGLHRGNWHLSATNSDNDVLVEVFWGRSIEPRYSTILKDHSIPVDVNHVTRELLPAKIGTTTFYDVTLRPGRWTVDIDGVKLDIMEARLIIDDQIDIWPNE